jgi:hypothetical protein
MPGCSREIDRGAVLWNLTGDNVAIKPRRTLLPVLTVLFVVSYGLLTMLVVEQGRTIDSQKGLIQVLFNDSVQLSNLKGMAIQKKQAEARAKKGSPTPQSPQLQSPVTPQAETKSHGTGKVRKPLPQKPPRDASDESDERRALVSI